MERVSDEGFGSMRDWNGQIQAYTEQFRELFRHGKEKESHAVMKQLRRLYSDFEANCELYGRIIISEAHLPRRQKTISPVDMGYAGGQKFIVKNIFFKFAVARSTSRQLYPNDACAMKVAGHELRALINLSFAILQLNLPIHLPLMTLLDYKGHRIICQSILPIRSEETLIYGSTNAGQTVYDGSDVVVSLQPPYRVERLPGRGAPVPPDCETFAELMRKLCTHLNLKGHRPRGHDHLCIYGPTDIEGHLGFDGRLYLLDVARLFPPKYFTPATYVQGQHLFSQLRPELVQSFPRPVSSDALSRFQHPAESDENDRELGDVMAYLTDAVVPRFARAIDEEYGEGMAARSYNTQSLLYRRERLSAVMHKEGINLRFLGLLRHHTKHPAARLDILLEILARTIKNDLREQLRLLIPEGESAQNRVVLRTLRCVLGTHKEARDFWNALKLRCELGFPGALSPLEREPSFDLKSSCDAVADKAEASSGVRMLLLRVQSICGLRLSLTCFNELLEKPLAAFEYTLADLRGYFVLTKAQLLNSLATAQVLHRKSLKHFGSAGSERLTNLSFRKFQDALERQPRNQYIAKMFASCLRVTAALRQHDDRVDMLSQCVVLLQLSKSADALLSVAEDLDREFRAIFAAPSPSPGSSSRSDPNVACLSTVYFFEPSMTPSSPACQSDRQLVLEAALRAYKGLYQLLTQAATPEQRRLSDDVLLDASVPVLRSAQLLQFAFWYSHDYAVVPRCAKLYLLLRDMSSPAANNNHWSSDPLVRAQQQALAHHATIVRTVQAMPAELFRPGDGDHSLAILGAVEIVLASRFGKHCSDDADCPPVDVDTDTNVDTAQPVAVTSTDLLFCRTLELVASSTSLRLVKLSLDFCCTDLAAMSAQLLAALVCPTLRCLELRNVRKPLLPPDGQAPPLDVEVLKLSACDGLTDDAIAALLLRCRRLQRLKFAALRHLGVASLRALASLAQQLSALTVVSSGAGVDGEEFAGIVCRARKLTLLNLSDTSLTGAALRQCPDTFRGLHELCLRRCVFLTSQDLIALSKSVSPPLLASLDLSGLLVDDSSLMHLARVLRSLRRLVLRALPQLSDKTFLRFARCNPGLRHLDVRGCSRISPAAIRELRPSGRAPLVELECFWSDRTAVDSRASPSSPHGERCLEPFCSLPPLRRLGLARCAGLSTEPLLALLQQSGRQLSALNLDACHCVGDELLAALPDCCPALTELSLRDCTRLSNGAFQQLFRRVGFVSLGCSGCSLFDSAVETLARRSGCLLRQLDLSRCSLLTNDALRSLCGAIAIATLSLAECSHLSDDGLAPLIGSLTRLEELNIQGCLAVSAQTLQNIKRLKRLRYLNVSQMTEETLASPASKGCFQGPLTHLALRGCQLNSDALEELVPGLSLQTLFLPANPSPELSVSDRLLTVLSHLHVLDVSNVQLDDGAFRKLFETARLLSDFRARKCKDLDREGSLTVLAENGRRLRALDVSDCPFISEDSLLHIAASCPCIQYLSIAGCCRVRSEVCSYVLSQLSFLSRFEACGSRCHHLTGRGAHRLLSHSQMFAPTRFSPRGASIRSGSTPQVTKTSFALPSHLVSVAFRRWHGIDSLTFAQIFSASDNLESLCLDMSDLDAACLEVLADFCTNLRHLSLVDCPNIDQAALRDFCYAARNLIRLELSLSNDSLSGVPIENLNLLRRDFPSLQIVTSPHTMHLLQI